MLSRVSKSSIAKQPKRLPNASCIPMNTSWPPPISPTVAPTNKNGQYRAPRTSNIPKLMPAGIQITLSPTTPEKYFRIKMEINACAMAAAIANAIPFLVY